MIDFLSPTAPDDPSTPFGEGVLILDVFRVLILVFCAVILVCSVASIPQSPSMAQKIRIASTAVLVLIVAGTEVSHMGDYGHWRLPLALLGTGLGAWGLWAFLRYETPGAPERQVERDERRRARRRARERAEL